MTRRNYREWLRWMDDCERTLASCSRMPAIPKAPRPHRKSDAALRILTEQMLALVLAAQAAEAGRPNDEVLAVFTEHAVTLP